MVTSPLSDKKPTDHKKLSSNAAYLAAAKRIAKRFEVAFVCGVIPDFRTDDTAFCRLMDAVWNHASPHFALRVTHRADDMWNFGTRATLIWREVFVLALDEATRNDRTGPSA